MTKDTTTSRLRQPDLHWSPVITGLQRAMTRHKLVLAIAPFVQHGAIEYLLKEFSWAENATVVTRWRASDVTSGVSDISVYPLLKRRGIRLLVNNALHMKLFVFDDGIGFITSANITGAGIGLGGVTNIEAGTWVTLSSNDASKLAELFGASQVVTDGMFERVQRYVEENRVVTKTLPPLILGDASPGACKELGLPLVHGADALWHIYSRLTPDETGDGSLQDGLHDIEILGIPPGLSRKGFDAHVRPRLYTNPVVSDVIATLERDHSLCFGEVVSRMQRTISADVAIGRRELKPYARAMYEWLPWIKKEIHWDRPRYSMILRLRSGSGA
jgi:hypothetical protein